MTHPANALQAGIYNRLTGHSALTTALGGSKVYDHVPQGTTAPYVRIGEDTLSESDNKTRNGWEFTITIHVWDFDVGGRKSVKTLLGHVYDALHKQEANISVSGFTLVSFLYEFDDSFQEHPIEGASDKYYHGVIRFRALVHA